MDTQTFNSDESSVIQKLGQKIDIGTADALNARFSSFFKNEKIRTIVFDLEKVRCCDSYGLKFLIHAQRRATAGNKRLLLFHPDIVMKELLATAGLLQFFTIIDA